MRSLKTPRPFASLSLTLLLACAPVAFDLSGSVPLHETSAMAKDGRSGSEGGSGGGRGRSGGSDDGHGGRGGDSSGSSGGSSGRSNGSDDGGSSGRNGGRSAGRDAGGASSRISGRDDHGSRGGRGNRQGNSPRQSRAVAAAREAKVERNGSHIEVTTRDGFRQEIEGGRYELKDPAGRTIVERRATADDRARLLNLSR